MAKPLKEPKMCANCEHQTELTTKKGVQTYCYRKNAFVDPKGKCNEWMQES